MEVKRCSGKKREGPDMEVKHCSGKKREGSGTELNPCRGLPGKKKKKRREKKRRSLFYVFRSGDVNHIYEIDVKSHFFPGTDDINYSGRSKATRIDGHDCPPPWMPIPYMCFRSTGKPGELPNDTAVVALGSKIYLIGGHWRTSQDPLPREVHVIDTAGESEFPEITKMSSVLNWGKRHPIAWTIGGCIYVLPQPFLEVLPCKGRTHMGRDLHNGKFFERYDPVSDSWTVLPSPDMGEIRHDDDDDDSDPFLVTSHAVLGSKLLISVGPYPYGFVFAYDTDRHGGWKKIRLLLGHCPHCRLDALPFDPFHSSPIGGNLVLCYPRASIKQPYNRLSGLLKKKLDMDCDNGYYVCRFDDVDDKGDLKASIVPFDGSSLGLRWAKFFYPGNDRSTQVTLFSEDLVLVAKVGRDYDRRAFNYCPEHKLHERDIGDDYLSLELFRVSEAAPDAECRYQASGTCSALFKLEDRNRAFHELFRCFVMEDGLFLD